MLSRRELLRTGVGVGLGASSMSVLGACAGVAGDGQQPSGGGGDNGGGKRAHLELVWWGGPDRHERTQKVVDLFEKKYPNVAIEGSFIDFDAYFQKLNTQAAGGGIPDVVQLGGGYVPQYAGNGQLLDLTDYVSDGTIDIGDFEKGQVEQGKVEGKQYAISLGGNMPAMIYNTTLIEKAGMEPPSDGITWDEFAAYCTDLAAKLPKGVWAVDDPSRVGNAFEVWFRQQQDESYTADGQAVFTEADAARWFEFWAAMRQDGLLTPGNVVAAAIQNGTNEGTPLVLGKAVFTFIWSNFLGQYQILTEDELGMMRFPSGGTQVGDYVQASQFFGVSAKSEFAEAACQFIDFFTHDEEAVEILGVERGVPASAATRELLRPSLESYDAAMVTFLDQGAETRPKSQLDPPNAAAVGEALQRAAQAIALSQRSIGEATKTFMEEAEKALAS